MLAGNGASTNLSTDDNTLEQLLHTPLDLDPAIPELAKITRESHPIDNHERISHWTMGTIWRLPLDPNNCTYEVTPTKLIMTDIRTSHLLGAKAHGCECWAERTSEEKTFWFFGHQSRKYSVRPISVTLIACKQIVAHMNDFMGNPLKPITWDRFGTDLRTSAKYAWPGTSYSTVTNFFIRRVNITVDDDHSTVIVNGANFVKRCSFSQRKLQHGQAGRSVLGKESGIWRSD
jgi:hypothetical protein